MHPFLTSDIPGTGGVIKDTPEDFRVEEIPAYLPCGSGEHLYLSFEKRGLTTLEAIRRIAGSLQVSERDIGYAGMKDAVGVTTQTISLPRVRLDAAMTLRVEGIVPLSARYHTNKLKLGHLKGNRFRITVRGIANGTAARAAAVLDVLAARGVPNYFGPQRYGAQGNSHLIGAAMLRGEWRYAVDCLIGSPDVVRDGEWRAAIDAYRQGDLAGACRLMPRHCRTEREVLQRLVARPDGWEKAFGAVHPRLKSLYLSAFQSFLFDRVVASRLDGLDRIMTGDLAWKHNNGACFLVADAAVEQPRADLFEISPSGPMFGPRMTKPAGEPLALETVVLEAEGVTDELLAGGSGLRLAGERRPLRVPLEDASARADDDSLLLEFTLPRGSYATSVVREITKSF